MNAITQTRGSAVSPRALSAHEVSAHELTPEELTGELLRSIQLNRANALALTRLSFALKSGDRTQAMEAMDRLHALDAEIERLAARLPAPSNDDDAQLSRHLGDQKLAIAFEKLALASSISGPGMVSEAHPIHEAPLMLTNAVPADEAPPPLADWPALPQVEPAEWHPVNPRRLLHVAAFGLAAALVLLLAALMLASL